MTVQRPSAVAGGQVPDAYVSVLVAAHHATVLGRDVQRHAVHAGLPLLEQGARLQVVHHDEVRSGFVHFLRAAEKRKRKLSFYDL